jgi:Zn-finger nucleic acid-binding protein
MRKCPICGEPMTQEVRDGVTIDVSPHGIFLDRTELFRLTEAQRASASAFPWIDMFRKEQRPPVDRDRKLTCPVSGEEMRIVQYKGVHIDVSSVGIWLDSGELEAIINNLKRDPAYGRGMALRLSELQF